MKHLKNHLNITGLLRECSSDGPALPTGQNLAQCIATNLQALEYGGKSYRHLLDDDVTRNKTCIELRRMTIDLLDVSIT